MKLDAGKLKAEADAHATRMQSSLWAPPDGEKDESWMGPLSVGPASKESVSRPPHMARGSSLDAERGLSEPRLNELERTVESLVDAVNRRPAGDENMPGWLLTAAEAPHAYEGPDPTRRAVCARLLPGTYARLQQVQRRLRLRTKAGTWEFLLRLGLAAAERLPTR